MMHVGLSPASSGMYALGLAGPLPAGPIDMSGRSGATHTTAASAMAGTGGGTSAAPSSVAVAMGKDGLVSSISDYPVASPLLQGRSRSMASHMPTDILATGSTMFSSAGQGGGTPGAASVPPAWASLPAASSMGPTGLPSSAAASAAADTGSAAGAGAGGAMAMAPALRSFLELPIRRGGASQGGPASLRSGVATPGQHLLMSPTPAPGRPLGYLRIADTADYRLTSDVRLVGMLEAAALQLAAPMEAGHLPRIAQLLADVATAPNLQSCVRGLTQGLESLLRTRRHLKLTVRNLRGPRW